MQRGYGLHRWSVVSAHLPVPTTSMGYKIEPFVPTTEEGGAMFSHFFLLLEHLIVQLSRVPRALEGSRQLLSAVKQNKQMNSRGFVHKLFPSATGWSRGGTGYLWSRDIVSVPGLKEGGDFKMVV